LFHRLHHDRKLDHFVKIEDDGNETLVATIEARRVQVRVKELRQFLAVKEMHIAVQFDCREHSAHALHELGLEEGGRDRHEPLSCWGLHYGDFRGLGGEHKSFSRLLGKRLVAPLPKEKSGFWGFADEESKEYERFIIGLDGNGDPETFTSDPQCLGNNFGANPEAPHYLTPVQFRKTVLDKYYQQPGKYSIEDSILRCGSLWLLQIDNHHEDRVCAWLGDLGRDLPHTEQLHWRSHNTAPTGGMSETYFRRQILAQFADTDRPELVFQQEFHRLGEVCKLSLGWPLLLPLSEEDAHYYKSLRVPSTDEQKDFDEVVLALAKILVDSLNEKELLALTPPDKRGSIQGSISRLEAVLGTCGAQGYEQHILFLRKLQNLRSASAAHRKGTNYRKIASEFDVDGQSLRSVFRGILERAIAVVEYLTALARSGKLTPHDAPSIPPRNAEE